MAKQPTIDDVRAEVNKMLDSYPPGMPIAATVLFKVNPKMESTFLQNIETLTVETRKLPGLNLFTYHKSKTHEAKDEYLIYEEWVDRDYFRTQWNSEHLKAFQNSVGALVTEAPDLNFFYGNSSSNSAVTLYKTGITKCWDTLGHPVPCKGSGQDGEIQAGSDSPSPRFVDHGDGTVTDNQTGVIWLKDPGLFNEVTWDQALDHAKMLASGIGGLNDGSSVGDWRLPNIRELRSLIDYATADPILPPNHPFLNVEPAIYWSSTSLASGAALAWMTTFGIGPAVFDLKTSPNRMWPVRGGRGSGAKLLATGQKTCYDTYGNVIPGAGSGQDGEVQAGVAFAPGRFVDHGDGTVTDAMTQLVWLKNANPFGWRTWEQALQDCNGLCHGKFGLTDGSKPGDWCLSNANELESLVDYGRFAPSLPEGQPFENVGPTSYWTSTTVASAPSQAMFTILGVGPTIFEHKEQPFLVWPVRRSRHSC